MRKNRRHEQGFPQEVSLAPNGSLISADRRQRRAIVMVCEQVKAHCSLAGFQYRCAVVRIYKPRNPPFQIEYVGHLIAEWSNTLTGSKTWRDAIT